MVKWLWALSQWGLNLLTKHPCGLDDLRQTDSLLDGFVGQAILLVKRPCGTDSLVCETTLGILPCLGFGPWAFHPVLGTRPCGSDDLMGQTTLWDGRQCRPCDTLKPGGPLINNQPIKIVTPQKYPKIFIIILLYILGMN